MEHTQLNAERQNKRVQLHRQRKKKIKRIRRILLFSAILLFAALIFILVSQCFKRRLEPTSIVIDNTNSDRETFISEFLEESSYTPEPGETVFKITVTPVSRKKCVIHVKNNTDQFFTGTLTVHDLATFNLNYFAPNITKTFEVDLGLQEGDNDFTCTGTFHSYTQRPIMGFTTDESPIGGNQFQATLHTDSITEEDINYLMYYYYIIGTLYNYDEPIDFVLYNSDNSNIFGFIRVDAKSESVDYFENGTLAYTADIQVLKESLK